MIAISPTVYLRALAGFIVACSLSDQSSFAQQTSKGLLTDFVKQTNKDDQLLYATSRDWFIKCTSRKVAKQSRCELESTFANVDEDLARRFSIQIVLTGKQTPPLAIVRTPLDLHLSKGVELRVGKSRVGKLTYRSCHSNGCVVPFSLVGQVSRRFIQGTRATLVFYDLKAKEQRMDLSLLGIANALRKARGFF